MKPYFRNVELECWLHRGRLGQTPWAICLYQASAAASEPLLQALEELMQDGAPAQRVLTLKPSQRQRSFTTLRLKLMPESSELRFLSIAHDVAAVTITMTSAGWTELHRAVKVWRDGGEDFGIGPQHARRTRSKLGAEDLTSGELWFWGPFFWAP